MERISDLLEKLAERVSSRKPIAFFFTLIAQSLILAFAVYGVLFVVIESMDISGWLPERPETFVVLVFMILWVISVALVSTLMLSFGSSLVRLRVTDDRLESIKSSGALKMTNSRIWLIGLSLYPFSDESCKKTFEKAIARGVSVRLLLYSPKTEFSKNRASSISGGGQSLADDIEGARGRFYDWKRELQAKYGDSASRFEVRMYRDNPSMSTFIIDDVALVGIYLKGGTGLTAPELVVHNKGAQASTFGQFEEHFKKVWEDAKPCEGG